jgi:protein involved in ribonucleotide reduction
MKVYFDSRVGSVKKFLDDCGIEATRITGDMIVEEPFVLVTYTTNLRVDGEKRCGMPPLKTSAFLENNHEYLVGVAASGDKVWGKDNFAKSAEKICNKYKQAKLICTFQKRGTSLDRQKFLEFLEGVEEGNGIIHRV